MSPEKPIILYLDTTTNQLFLGVSQGEHLLTSQCIPCESHRYHSAIIVPAIQAMLSELSLSPKNLHALAVNIGPGSFTGIRTGLITARTMAQFLQLPVFAFNAFELLAAGHDTPVTVMLDALRGKAYAATLSFDSASVNYQWEPTLIQLNPSDTEHLPGCTETPVFAPPSLTPLLSGRTVHPLPDNFQSPQAMLSLIQQYGGVFKRSWQEVKPLYIQEPSITIRKKPTPAV